MLNLKTLNLHPATAEQEEREPVAAATCSGFQQQSAKQKHKKNTHWKHPTKARMMQHINEVQRLVKHDNESDSCVLHFA